MVRNSLLLLLCVSLSLPTVVQADIITDWNHTLIDAIRATPEKSNPGNATREWR
jgi:hypothetical protein